MSHLETMRAALTNLLFQYEGVYDCVDNDGKRYQSEGAAAAERAARAALRSSDSTPSANVERNAIIEECAKSIMGVPHKFGDRRLLQSVADAILALRTSDSTPSATGALEALRELVRLKDLKELIESEIDIETASHLQADYDESKPKAWAAARAVVRATDRYTDKG